MAELFSAQWMEVFKDEWNKEPELSDALAAIGFASVIGYGFQGEDQPRGVLIVENGVATQAGAYNGETMNWDLRASEENWRKWLKKGVGMTSLGASYVSGKLKFKIGDYGAMVKDPRMAGPFIKSFTVMGRVPEQQFRSPTIQDLYTKFATRNSPCSIWMALICLFPARSRK